MLNVRGFCTRKGGESNVLEYFNRNILLSTEFNASPSFNETRNPMEINS